MLHSLIRRSSIRECIRRGDAYLSFTLYDGDDYHMILFPVDKNAPTPLASYKQAQAFISRAEVEPWREALEGTGALVEKDTHAAMLLPPTRKEPGIATRGARSVGGAAERKERAS